MSNEIKVTLKEAHKLFKQNDYEEVIKKCKHVLKKGKNNYNALVLLAAAMQQVEKYKTQAALALRKAIEIQPTNPTGWQGLVSYYEKQPQNAEAWSNLAIAHCKVLLYDSNASKFLAILDKVLELCLKLNDESTLAQVIECLTKLQETSSEEKANVIAKVLVQILTQCTCDISKHHRVLKNALAIVTKDHNVMNRQTYCAKYLQLLYTLNETNDVLNEGMQMHKDFPQDISILEWICCVYYEQYMRDGTTPDVQISQFYEALLKLNSGTEAGRMAKAVHGNVTGNVTAARDCLDHFVSLKPKSLQAWTLLSEIRLKLHCFESAEEAATRAIQLTRDSTQASLTYKLHSILAVAMSRSNNREKLKAAAKLCQKLINIKPSSILQITLVRIKVSLDADDVEDELNKLESDTATKEYAAIFRAIRLKEEKRFEEAIDLLVSGSETSEAWTLLGKMYWEMADYGHSLMAFLNGVQKDRYNWDCFVYLGHYYRQHGNDMERSKKCYRTALQINPGCEQAGIGLSTTFRLLEDSDANMRLLQKVTSQSSGPKWAWLQLGIQYLDQGNAPEAIKALQHVIRIDPNDNHSWETLADAYLVRGAYTSALKSYQRALDLHPRSLYPMIQLANIKLIIGQLLEAKEDFEIILLDESNHVPALKGLGETCLGLAKECLEKNLLGRARVNLQQAADCLTTAVIELKGLSCLWKLLGDVCYRTATLSDNYCYLSVNPILVKSVTTEKFVIIKRMELFKLSARCYCRALSLSQNSSLLWHDLACCYYTQLKYVTAETERKDIANRSLAAAKHAITLCPTMWLHWNMLGVICMSHEIWNYALAQHCFIMAIDREPNNAIVWCNLGTLYMILDDPYKANEAYSRAQRADPAYVNSWIGQGLIAENMKKRDAMDLFRHSIELGYHDQASLGYAHWVLTMLSDPDSEKDPLYRYIIKNMHALPVATDVLNWYIERNPDDVCALNALALLLEWQDLYKSAAQRLATAFRLCKMEEKDSVSINLARVLIHLGKSTEAVQLCEKIKKTTCNSQCHLALALYKAEQYEKSYATYELALESAETDTDKANILCVMAGMAHIFQRVDDTRTLLFQCVQIQPPLITGYLAAAALGILQNDANLTTLVLKALKWFQTHRQYEHHITKLSAYYHLAQGDVKAAVRVIANSIYRRPDDVRHWTQIIRILLEIDSDMFDRCAQKTLFLGRSSSRSNIIHVSCASSLSHLTDNVDINSFRAVQKTLFTYPGNVESWANFIAVILTRCVSGDQKIPARWISALIDIVRENWKVSEQMRLWLSNNKKEVDKIANRMVET